MDKKLRDAVNDATAALVKKLLLKVEPDNERQFNSEMREAVLEVVRRHLKPEDQ